VQGPPPRLKPGHGPLAGRCLSQASQTLDDATTHQVLAQDRFHVLLVDVGVPGVLRIDDDYRPFRTTIQAAGGVDAHTARTRDSELLGTLLHVIAQALRVALGAALASVVATVGAKEYVVLVIGHDRDIPLERCTQVTILA
jgi:hypothetical protein